ncbi:hypothetical protein ACNTMW_30975 [Planosporangium sp. 12N6]|uniref:hypothetical protein n=1 Tax=Planosporangium spinosum TaxID=3402278 RepID=UPI003CF68367
MTAGCTSRHEAVPAASATPGTASASAADGPASSDPGLPQAGPETPGHDDDKPAPPPPPLAQAAATAGVFAAAWVRGGLPADQWWAGVAPLCEAGFAARLRTVDPANLPAMAVTGQPVPVGAPPAAGPAVYTVATDGGILTVTVAALGGKWLVTGNDFTRAAR